MELKGKKIGIIAGGGQFPRLVARGARGAGAKVFIYGFFEQTDPALEAEADSFALGYIGKVGKLIDFFKSQGVTHLCLAGSINKSKVLDFKPDLRAAKLLFKVRKNQGDDAILRVIADELSSEGFVMVQAADLVPGLAGDSGVLTRRAPSPEEMDSIRWGWPIGKQLGAYDIGQCMVVKERLVIAVEALEGTDAALERGGALGGKGCIALKMFKPGQDKRADLPSIGLTTLEILAKYGYSCLAFEAGKTLFFDRDAAVALADKHNIAIIGVTEDDF